MINVGEFTSRDVCALHSIGMHDTYFAHVRKEIELRTHQSTVGWVRKREKSRTIKITFHILNCLRSYALESIIFYVANNLDHIDQIAYDSNRYTRERESMICGDLIEP